MKTILLWDSLRNSQKTEGERKRGFYRVISGTTLYTIIASRVVKVLRYRSSFLPSFDANAWRIFAQPFARQRNEIRETMFIFHLIRVKCLERQQRYLDPGPVSVLKTKMENDAKFACQNQTPLTKFARISREALASLSSLLARSVDTGFITGNKLIHAYTLHPTARVTAIARARSYQRRKRI